MRYKWSIFKWTIIQCLEIVVIRAKGEIVHRSKMFGAVKISFFAIVVSLVASNPISSSNSIDENNLIEVNHIEKELPFSADMIRECKRSGKSYCEIQYTNEFKRTIKQLLANKTMDSLQKPSKVDDSMCASSKGLIYPTFAQDVTGEWAFVINQDQLRQSVEIEVCLSSLPRYVSSLDFRSKRDELLPFCVPVNRIFRLYSIVNDTIQIKKFSFPSLCTVGLYATLE